MERKRKEELADYFAAPRPERKRAFVRQYGSQKMNLFHVVAMQTRYLSKWVWIFSGLFFGCTYWLSQIANTAYVSMLLAAIPFLVMISVTETTRSYRYGMEELELSARFSLKSIVLSRMVVLGLGNLVVLTGVMLLLGSNAQINMVHIMTPYFLTAGGSLYIVRYLRGSESTFPCMALAVLICALELYLPWQFEMVFSPENMWIWAFSCVMGIMMTVRESYRTIRMTENLA